MSLTRPTAEDVDIFWCRDAESMLEVEELDDAVDWLSGLATLAETLGRCVEESASFSSICTAVSTLTPRFLCFGLMSGVVGLVVALVVEDRFLDFSPPSLPLLSLMFCGEIEPFTLNRL